MEYQKSGDIFSNRLLVPEFQSGMDSSPGMASENKANWDMTQAEAEIYLEGMQNEGWNGNDTGDQVSYMYRNFIDLPSLPENLSKDDLILGIQQRFNTQDWTMINEAIDQLRCINKQYPVDMNEVFKLFWQDILAAISNLRSAVSKNSLMFVTELLS